MDFKAIKEQLAASRRVEIPLDGVVYRVELPTEYALRVALDASRNADGVTAYTQAFRGVLKTAVTGWEGAKTTHILPDAPDEPLPFSSEALGLLLDMNQGIADELVLAISEKRDERRARMEAARKNS